MPPGRQVSVLQMSSLSASAEDVWRRAVSPEGINHELGPWMRMTMPRSVRGMTIDEVPVGEPLGRSWILLFGVLPVDYDDLMLAERGPGFRFLERSKLLNMSSWQHEREVTPTPAGCEVTDRLTFELRRVPRAIPGMHGLARAVIAMTFRHRHRRLVAWFGAGK